MSNVKDQSFFQECGKRGGRPSKLTDETVAAICKSVAQGNYPQTAARSNGVALTTWNTWVRLARQGRQPHRKYLDQIEEAQAKAEETLVKKLKQSPNARDAQYILERRFRHRWAKSESVNIQRSIEDFVERLEPLMSSNAYGELLKALQMMEQSE